MLVSKRKCLSVLVIALFLIMNIGAVAVAAPIKEGFSVWTGPVPSFDSVKKPWTIKFSKPLLASDVKAANIYITDVDNTVFPSALELSTDGQQVTITPSGSYTAGSDYRLYISDQIHDRNGNKLSQAKVMPFKVSPASSSLSDNISIGQTGGVETKDGEVLLTSPAASSATSGQRSLAAASSTVEDFEYNISYVAHVLPVTVDKDTNGDGTLESLTVMANDIYIDENRAFVSYNYRGGVYAGAVQILDISDALNPVILSELKFNNMDINAVYYDSSSGKLLFGGGVEGVFSTGETSFVARVDAANPQVSDIASSITALPSSCVTSITKKDSQYYVGVGANNGAVIVLNENMQQINSRDINDVRDIDSYDQSFVALTAAFPTGSSGKLISSLDADSSSDITVSPFSSPECKSTIDLVAGSDKVLEDEDALACLALANEGFQVIKMGGTDYCNQMVYSLPNPTMSDPDADAGTVGVAYDGGLIFLANGDYGFQVLQIKGMTQDPVTGATSIDPAQFAELVGYHELTGSIYDGHYRANNIAYKQRHITVEGCSREQNLLFVAIEDGVNIYTLTNKNDYEYTPIPDETWEGIHEILVEGQAQDLNGPLVMADANIKLLQDAQVRVVFVDEAASYRNSVGCFITTLSPAAITGSAQITDDKQMVFENASKVNSGGTLVRGDTKLLLPNPVPKDSYIGGYFLQNGYDNSSATDFYTIPALNSDGDRHYVAFVDDINQKIVIALEDLTDLGDKDFNDVIYILDINPFSAADISGLPKMSDLLAAINPLTIASIANVTATVNVGETYTMPTTVTATMSDGTTSEVAVTWNGSIDTSTSGVKETTGTVTGYSGTVSLSVTVNAPAASCPVLDKIWAVGVSSTGKAVEMSGSSGLYGTTACNTTTANSINFAYSTLLHNGDLYIGPNGNPDSVVKFTGDGRNATTNIPEGTIKNLTALQTFALPQFPTCGALTARDSISAGWWPIPSGGFVINENGQYDSISVTNALTINVGDQDRIIRTSSLSVTGTGQITVNRTGTGKLKIFVDDNLTIAGSSSINLYGETDAMEIYYSGASPLNFPGTTVLNGSLYSRNENASITINTTGGIKGHIITGSNIVTVSGDTSVNIRAIYAPNAQVSLTGSSKVKGTVIAKNIILSGASFIYYDSSMDMDFFNSQDW